jgi:phage gpG-like protein
MISIEINDAATIAVLHRAAAQFDNMLPLYTDIGAILIKSTKERFAKGESPEGVKWAPKSPATMAKYGARKSNRVDSRPLFGPSGILSSQIFSEPEADQVAVGSARVYAAMMQKGGTKAQFPHLWGDIPARPFIGLSAEDIKNITAQTEDWMRGLFGQP